MLKRAGEYSEGSYRDVALEPWIAALSAAVMGSSCLATFTAKSVLPALTPASSWDFISERGRFTLTLEGGPGSSFGERELAGMRLAAYLSHSPIKASLDLHASGPDKGGKSWNYLVRSDKGRLLLATYLEDSDADYPVPVDEASLGKGRSVGLVLHMSAAGLEKGGFENCGVFPLGGAAFRLSNSAGEFSFPLSLLDDHGNTIKFCVREDPMDAVNDRCRPSLNLGKIEMKIDEVLALRPGMEITFERPRNFRVTLEVMGTPMARGTLTIHDQTVSLVIDELERPAEI